MTSPTEGDTWGDTWGRGSGVPLGSLWEALHGSMSLVMKREREYTGMLSIPNYKESSLSFFETSKKSSRAAFMFACVYELRVRVELSACCAACCCALYIRTHLAQPQAAVIFSHTQIFHIRCIHSLSSSRYTGDAMFNQDMCKVFRMHKVIILHSNKLFIWNRKKTLIF